MDIWFIIIVGGGTLATIIWLWKALFSHKTVTTKRPVKDRRWSILPKYSSSYSSADLDYPTFSFDNSSFDSSSSSDFGGFDGGDSGGSGGGGYSD